MNLDKINLDKIFQSKLFRSVILGLLVFIVVLAILKIGMFIFLINGVITIAGILEVLKMDLWGGLGIKTLWMQTVYLGRL